MFTTFPSRLVRRTPEEEARRQAAKIRATAPAGQTYSGSTSFGSSEGYVTPTVPKPSPISQKVEAAKSEAVGIPYKTPEQPKTTSQQLESKRDELIGLANNTTDATAREVISQQLRDLNAQINAPADLRAIQLDAQRQQEAAQINAQKRREDIANKPGEAGQKLASQAAAIGSRYAESPEGVAQSGTPNVISAVETARKKGLEQAIASDPEIARLNAIAVGSGAKFQSAQQQLDELKKLDVQGYLTSKLEIAQKQIDNATEIAKLQREATKTKTDLWKDLVGANLTGEETTEQLTQSIAGTDIPISQALLARESARIKAEIAKTKDVNAQAKLELELRKMEAEIGQIGVEKPTADQQNFGFYQELQQSDPAMAEKFAQLVGFGDKQNEYELKGSMDEGFVAFDKKTGTIKPLGKYDSQVRTGEVRLDVQDGTVLERGQCGEFVNDALGVKSLFQDSYASKASKVNSQTPTAGGAFIMNTGDANGHVGIVEKVYSDGSIDVVDSNFYNKSAPETVSRRHITDPSGAGIVGYYAPSAETIEFSQEARDLAYGRSTISELKASGYKPDQIKKIRNESSTIATQEGILDEQEQKSLEANKDFQNLKSSSDLLTSLKNYKNLVETYGIEIGGEGASKLNSAYADLKIKWKEAANLGALTGPDVAILEEAILPAANWGGAFTQFKNFGFWGEGGILSSLEQANMNISDSAKTAADRLKVRNPKYNNNPTIKQLLTPFGFDESQPVANQQPAQSDLDQWANPTNSIGSEFGLE